MADKTGIEWTDATWNPTVGCSIVSPACTNCYAMAMAARIERMAPSQGRETHYAGTTKTVNGKPVWTGKLAQAPDDILMRPLRWKRPRRIFVNSMSDLFHEDMPEEWIDRVFAVMALAPQHTFQILTKRPERMRRYMAGSPSSAPYLGRLPLERIHLEAAGHMEGDGGYLDALKREGNLYSLYLDATWPLPNVWLGVTAEDQARADQRIPELLATPAAVRFVSAEPLLGPINFREIVLRRSGSMPTDLSNRLGDYVLPLNGNFTDSPKLDWIIVGGESGPGARPTHPDWIRSIRDQCAATGVAFHFKQWGEWAPAIDRDRDDPDWRADYQFKFSDGEKTRWINFEGGRGFHGERFHVMRRGGKKTAGRTLDGRTHDAFPQVAP